MDEDKLKEILASTDVSRRDKLIAILFYQGTPIHTTEIKKLAKSLGLYEIDNWNVSDSLIKAKKLVGKVKSGWILKSGGQTFVKENFLSHPLSTKSTAKSLRNILSSIRNTESRDFIEEAIQCLEIDAHKAAVVFSWIGAISVLYDFVLANRLTDFNNEARRRDTNWKNATKRDDFTEMKDVDFLDILGKLSVINKNVKEHLKNTCLNLRNSCGHPNSIKVGKHNVEAHIEFLIQNVFAVF